MVRRFFLAVLAAALLPAAHPLVAAGAPQRIVSTAPSITQMLYALGLGDRIVGVSNYDRYPPAALTKPKIGDYTAPNLEAIAALKPDLVVIQTNPIHLADRLHALHLNILEIDQENIAGLYNSIHVVGAATGASPAATLLVENIRRKLDQIRRAAASLPTTRMMFVVGRTPNRLDGLVVVGKASYLNEIIEIAGGSNIFRDAPSAYPSVSLEEVLARDPQVVIDIGDMSDQSGITPAQQTRVAALWQRLPSIAAVKDHRVFAVDPNIFVVPGPRIVDAAQELVELLHPGAVK